MNLLPFENIEIESPLTKNEIENVIKNNIVWNTDLGMTFTKNPIREYEGFIDNGTFKLRRIFKKGMNSFVPIVTGTISDSENCVSRIGLKLRLHKFVSIFYIVVTIFLGSILLSPVSSSPISSESQKEFVIEYAINEDHADKIVGDIEKSSEQKNTNWTSLFMFFIAPYLIVTIIFNYEANIVKNKLKSILKV